MPSLSFDLPATTIERYVVRRAEDVRAFEKALAAEHYEILEMIGHRLKGNAASFGFPDLGKLGAEIERSAGEGARAALAEQLQALKAWLESRPGKELRP